MCVNVGATVSGMDWGDITREMLEVKRFKLWHYHVESDSNYEKNLKKNKKTNLNTQLYIKIEMVL